MNSNLLRGLLNAIAIELVAAWIIAAFLGHRWGYLLVAAACLFLMTGYMWFCDQLRADAEFRRANRPPVITSATYEPAHATTIIDGGRQPAWRDDILRRDPLAYPLTKRATWPHQVGAPE